MKRLIFLACLGLMGCESLINPPAPKVYAEDPMKLYQRAFAKCALPFPKYQPLQAAKCENEGYTAMVGPEAASSPEFQKFLLAREKAALKCQQGKISEDEKIIEMKQAKIDFDTEVASLSQKAEESRQQRLQTILMMQAAQPKSQPIIVQPYIMPTRPQAPSLNCQSYMMGNTMQTNCN